MKNVAKWIIDGFEKCVASEAPNLERETNTDLLKLG